MAKINERVPLPVFSHNNLKPLSILTPLLNRRYVNPGLLKSTNVVASKLNQKYPGTVISYLDAGFPFINGFPLLPHLSHDDGEKLDIAFFYLDAKTRLPLNNDAPSFIGYGVYEEPALGEFNQPLKCRNSGNWQYGALRWFVPQWKKEKLIFDAERTGAMTRLFIDENSIGKIFIEPHLKNRLGLNSGKVRYHGCHAVRHDDHIHIQL